MYVHTEHGNQILKHRHHGNGKPKQSSATVCYAFGFCSV